MWSAAFISRPSYVYPTYSQPDCCNVVARASAGTSELIDVYTVKPKLLKKLAPGQYFVDFGKEITGQFYMTLKGEYGQKVTIRAGEELDDNNPDLARWQMRCNCDYEDVLTLSGEVDKVEFFDYKAFRYVNVFTDRDNLSPDTFEAIVRHHKFEPKYKLDTEVPYLKDIFAICENALKEVTEDSEYQFKVMNAKNIGKKVTEDQRVKLADMFGSKFETKK